ncbi:hypothetical protein ASG52_04550 [Methylobacterium sp. Leaf456]|nr:hypothetical protein ASG52_04550 [Methylobacterium sp. Leaf456]
MLALALAAGLGLGVALIRWAGAEAVGEALVRLGWPGFFAVCLLQAVVVATRAAALRVQFGQAAFTACLGARLVREGAQNVLWMVPGLGVVAGIRALTLMPGMRAGPVRAAACTFIDMLVESTTLMLCALLSLLLVLGVVESGQGGLWLAAFAAAALPLVALAGLGRHAGARRLVGKLVRKGARAFGQGIGRDLTDATAALTADRRRMLRAGAIHLGGWVLGAGQIWLAARTMGVELSLPAALALNSLVVAVTGLLFVVPWGAGVQEGSFVLVGGLFGVDPATALVLSLVQRARDLALGVPGVGVWAVLEMRRRNRAADEAQVVAS